MTKSLKFDFMGSQATGDDPAFEVEHTKADQQLKHVRAMVFDLEAAKERFSEYEEMLGTLIAECEALEVVDEDSAALATEIIGRCRTLFDQIETLRKKIINDPDGFVRGINSFTKIFKDKLTSVAIGQGSILNRKLSDYTYKRETERRKLEEKMRRETEQRQKEMDEDAKKAGVTAPKIPEMKVPKKSEPIRTDKGSTHSTMAWTFEIENPDEVPRNYCVPSDKLIKAAVKAGIRKIAGVRIFEYAKVSHRKA